VFLGMIRTPPEKRDNAAILAARQEASRVLPVLDQQLSKTRFVAGDTFTMGDIPVGAAVYRAFALGEDRTKLANIGRWYDELGKRPGYREHIMLPLS
jgi:glutathione S-transferase